MGLRLLEILYFFLFSLTYKDGPRAEMVETSSLFVVRLFNPLTAVPIIFIFYIFYYHII